MADGKTLVIGTVAQEFFTLDEDTLKATIHLLPTLPRISYSLNCPSVVAMANGIVFLLTQEMGIAGGGADGAAHLIKWDSKKNTYTELGPLNGASSWSTKSMVRSADRKWAAFAVDKFYLYSSDDDSITSVVDLATVNPPADSFGVRGYALNADGSKIAVASASQVTFLDHSFNVLATVPYSSAFQDSGTTVRFTADGNRLIMQNIFPVSLEMVDANSYTALGYQPAFGDRADVYSTIIAIDGVGRAFVGFDGGYEVIDTAQTPVPNPTEAGATLDGPECPLPNPPNAGLNASLTYSTFNSSLFAGYSFYFAGAAGTVSADGTQVTAPASSQAGPVDVECVDSAGSSRTLPFAFSYGAKAAAVSANLLSPVGEQSLYAFGFGFFSDASSVPAVSVGGLAAANVEQVSLSKGSLQGVRLQPPTLSASTTADVTVTSAYGSSTVKGAVSYIPSAHVVATSGVLQLLFDSHRNLLYALKASEIDVLDPISLTWNTPFALPAFAGSANYGYIALSPDGSRLVAVASAGYAAVVNPDDPSKTFSVSTPNPGFSWGRVVITKENKAVFGGRPPVEIDLATSTGKVIPTYLGWLIASPPDGSVIYGIDTGVTTGQAYRTDISTYKTTSTPQFGAQFWSDLAVSADGSHFAGILAESNGGDVIGFFESGLHLVNFNEGPLLSPADDSLVLGSVFGPKGNVLVVALGDSIEFWDTQTGTLRARLMTPEELQTESGSASFAAPQVALDSTGQTIFAVSASGISAMTLPVPVDDLPVAAWNGPLPAPQAPVSAVLGPRHGSYTVRRSR